MSESSNNRVVVERVSEGCHRVSITGGPAGPQSRLEIAVRSVPAYGAAVFASWAVLVSAIAFAVRPTVATWPWTWLAGLDVVVTITTGLVVARLADRVWRRVVESVVVDGLGAVHDLDQATPGELPRAS